jgi:hypothetical protein
MKRRQAGLPFRIIRGQRDEDADPPHSLGLRARCERPSGSAATEKRNELASPHSITSSARASRIGDRLRLSPSRALRRARQEESMITVLYQLQASLRLSGASISPGETGNFVNSWQAVLRVIGCSVPSLSRRCFGAAVGDEFCRNTSDQRRPLHRPFHPLLALLL